VLLYVGIPSIDGKAHVETVDSLLSEQLLAHPNGDHLLVDWVKGCSLIGHARNVLVRNFLEIPECDRMVFVDSDLGWSCGELMRLAKRPEAVVGCTYRRKQEEPVYSVHGTPSEAHDGLLKVDGVPGGFVAISRTVFETIKAQKPERTYTGPDGKDYYDFFPTGFGNHILWGEDYAFCALWRECGGDVFLDPKPVLHHVGMKTYSGSYAWNS
jgi:hypothetical protein